MSWPASEQAGTGPLAGVRVLDLTRILAGPFATTIMADLGADVIKVERPGAGDETRRWGPPFAPTGDAAYFYACNRGRRSLALDLREAADRDLLLELVADADLLIENFLPGAMERMRLGDDVLQARNPRLVHCVIAGYSSDSQRAGWPGLDFVIQAHAGILGVTGTDPDHAVKAGVPIADLAAGLFSTIGALAALRRAQATGTGARLEVSLTDACTALLVNQAMNYLVGGVEPRPAGNTHPNVAPYQTVQAADRALALAASSDAQFERLCRVVGLEELLADERFQGNENRVAHRAELERRLEVALAVRPAAEWVRELNEAGVAAAVVNSVGELLEDPDTRAGLIGYVRDGEHDIAQVRTPIRIDGEPLALGTAPPRVGQHDDEIRAALPPAIAAEEAS